MVCYGVAKATPLQSHLRRTMAEPKSVVIRPARNILGSLRVPGDKSISHRYAMLAALADGPLAFRQLCSRRRLRQHAGMRARAGLRGRAR